MSVSLPDDIQGVAEANAELERLMAADAEQAGSAEQGARSQAAEDDSANTDGQRAGQQGTETQGDKKDDTLAAAEEAGDGAGEAGNKEQGAGSQADKKGAGKTDGAEKKQEPSRYQKARERQEKSWAELNAQKEAFAREREDFERQRKEHESRLKQAEQEFSPEAYEQAADKFEKAGKFDLAELAREKADQLRKNPPAKPGDDPAAREWTLKAGIDFPDLAKQNSPVQLRVAQLFKEEPELKAHPKGVYLAARLASLEQDLAKAKAVAASVSDKDKQISDLQKRIKGLEEATAPGHGGATTLPAAKGFSDKSDDEQYEELRQMAVEAGALR